ncbi:GNAT family N-acetyltransferase [Natronomonas halophila]|uniref:GNAT family N-acetyltransferase n=1 Tax=Natronomonas halophila TaxID=2747817 RepID=UPI0015B556D9|nr:GNAT family N-acetyltransferase [Natronomonas halophila]QLD85087.1 GNAT family N-acetyltransferase [Natronomonas halophila]
MYTGRFPRLTLGRSRHAPPVDFEDDEGRAIALRTFGNDPVDDEREALVDMYLAFDPAERSLGVPPIRESRIRTWQGRILDGYCVLAWDDERAIGQAVLVEDEHTNHELAVFIHQDYHHAGIGTHLVEALLAYGKDQGVDNVWLLVEHENEPARQLYDDVGFTVTDDEDHAVVMALSL